METVTTEEKKVYTADLKLSIRRKPGLEGLPGEDTTEHRWKIGSSIKGKASLSGLTKDEEKRYLPGIIGVDSTDSRWHEKVEDYWRNVSVIIPSDAVSVTDLPGLLLEFTLEFDKQEDRNAFISSVEFDQKGEISKRGRCINGIADFVLFRYCLVYGRVANSLRDVNKSPKIWFYLYSKSTEDKIAYGAVKNRLAASNMFAEIITDDNQVNSILRMFGQLPELFKEMEERHMALYKFVEEKPLEFLKFAKDDNLKIKSAILRAVELGILHKPVNTDSYYYGQNNEIFLGGTLDDAALWWKSQNDEQSKGIKTSIIAQIKNS